MLRISSVLSKDLGSLLSIYHVKTERFLSVIQPPTQRKISYKDETIKNRDYNLFSKKVPKNAETVNIQVATCDFLSKPIFAFVRLGTPIVLDDFSEINKPTR